MAAALVGDGLLKTQLMQVCPIASGLMHAMLVTAVYVAAGTLIPAIDANILTTADPEVRARQQTMRTSMKAFARMVLIIGLHIFCPEIAIGCWPWLMKFAVTYFIAPIGFGLLIPVLGIGYLKLCIIDPVPAAVQPAPAAVQPSPRISTAWKSAGAPMNP